MNFLLHREIALRETGSALVGVGAMLPDLWRMADRRVRPRKLESEEAPTDVLEVLLGVEHHRISDELFHHDDVFRRGEAELIRAFSTSTVRAPRMQLLAHPIWEMCIDGALVRRSGPRPIADAIGRDLATARDASISAADIHHFWRIDRPEQDRDVFIARMDRIADELRSGRWIGAYETGRGLAMLISGVRARVGLSRLDDHDLEALGRLLDERAALAEAALRGVLAWSVGDGPEPPVLH